MIKSFTKPFFLLLMFCLTTLYVQAQSIVVSGSVIDKLSRQPIPGAGITVKGKTVGTSADQNGKYSFSTTEKAPFTVVISYLGYTSVERLVTGNTTGLNAELEQAGILGQEVVISASRTPEKILESPVSIERMGQGTIREIAAPSFYDALNNMKGVEVSTQSLTFKSINTRGFNSNGNTRFNQFVDGMDNQAPGLNFAVGNIVGINDLDVDNVELLPGASSALYGAGGINGTMLMTSKSPFDYQGPSFQFKTGINHVNDNSSDVQPYNQLDVRLAKALSSRFAVKGTFSFLQAKDWQANNFSNFNRDARVFKDGNRSSDPNYDGINVYGDEVSQNMKNVAQSVLNAGTSGFVQTVLGLPAPPTAAQIAAFKASPGGQDALTNFLKTNTTMRPFFAGLNTPGLLPNQNVSRTGYDESALVDYKTQSLKISGSANYRITKTIEAVAQVYWGSGTSVYTGSDRYSLRNFSIGQYNRN